jgi:hypothetical protein
LSQTDKLQQLLSEQGDKQEQIDRVKANLPLPDDPPGQVESSSIDKSVTDAAGVNVKLGTGGSALREPATAGSSVREDGEELKKHTEP